MADSASGRASASADDNARTTDNLSIPPLLDRTGEAPTPEQMAGQPAIISPCAAVGTISVPAQVLTLTRRIKALIEKVDRAAEKAEQFYKGQESKGVMSDARRLHSRFLSRRCDGPDSAQDTAVRAIRLVLDIRDRIETAMRAPGDLIAHTRQDDDSSLNDLGIIARLIRELAERL